MKTSYTDLQYGLNKNVVWTLVMWLGIIKGEYSKPENVCLLHDTIDQTCFKNCDNS
jgi:hypothetical protein